MTPERRRAYWMTAINMGGVAASIAAHRIAGRTNPRLAKPAATAVNLVGLAAHFHLERRYPAREGWSPKAEDFKRDVGFALTSGIALGGFSAAAKFITRRLNIDLGLSKVAVLPGVFILATGFDIWHYTAHRIGHEQGWGWRIHSVHHSPTRFYIRIGLHTHIFETGPNVLFEAILHAVLRPTGEQLAGIVSMHALNGAMSHSNANVDHPKVLNWIFNTPEVHRWHHSQDYDEGNTNYSSLFMFIDHLLGTYYCPGREYSSEIGIGRMPHFPRNPFLLQLTPFRWRRIVAANAETWNVPAGTPTVFHTPSEPGYASSQTRGTNE